MRKNEKYSAAYGKGFYRGVDTLVGIMCSESISLEEALREVQKKCIEEESAEFNRGFQRGAACFAEICAPELAEDTASEETA